MDLHDEIRKIEESIRQLRAASESGALPPDVAEASIHALEDKKAAYQAQVAGNGAIAQGTGAKAIGKGGTLVEGDYVAEGGKLEKRYYLPEDASPAELRAAYLNHLFESVSRLQLSGIDPKTASDAEARLNLGAVYTALLTFSAEDHEAIQKGRREDIERLMERGETRRASALAQLNRHNRLVLLGDPGSGKTTFVNFVAMCLAGETLGHKDANLAALTAPLPQEEDPRRNREEKPQPQPWEHGPLLPLRVILRDFAARGLPPIGEKASAKTLWDFIVSELEAWALRAFEKPLAQELLRQGGLLLLDGLDEVPEADQRRTQIKQSVEGFAASFPKCRILVTSRTYAYQRQDWRLNGFAESALAPFSRGQIRNFVERWYAHIAILRRMGSDDAKGRAELLKRAIFNSDRLLELAERPLLLTLMASLHAWRGGTLPEKREELYADAIDLLLDWWESPKAVRNARGDLVVRQPSLAEWLKVDRAKMRALLEELAYQAHARQQETTGAADIPEGDLVSGLMRLSQNPDVNPRQLVEYLSLRAGLLIPRGVGVYTFPHRTFQEYLAACYLTDHDYPEKVAELACADFNRWREVALLAGAKAARGTASAIWSLVDALCYAEPGDDAPEKGQWGAHLAGQALVESGGLNNIAERNQPKLARAQKWLVTILETGKLPAIERARAGDTLAVLGDPRPEVLACERMAFCHVPAGEFLFGDKKEKTHLPEYWMGKYPVTNDQFRQFAQAGGYDNPDFWAEARRAEYWTEAGFKGKWDEAPRKAPADFGEPFNLPNHPVVGVSWYEALAFTRWLSSQLPVAGHQWSVNWGEEEFKAYLQAGQLRVTLPGEEQWEKAARGPLTPTPLPPSPLPRGEGKGGREYPWGDAFDPNKANTAETGIGATTAVGCFPGGESPYGCLDMSGNVWEWVNGEQPLRGGSYIYFADRARCAYRLRLDPVNGDWYYGFRVVVSPFFSL